MRHPYITDIRREAIEEGKIEGRQEGAEQKAIETAKKLIENRIPKEIIANCTGLALEEVEKLTAELSK